MDQDGIAPAYLMLELPYGFQKRLAFNVAYRTAHFDNGNACFFIGKITVKPAFDFVGNMRNNLHSAAAVITPALFLQDGPVNLSGGYVGVFVQAFVNETFIMPQVKIGFGAVVGYEYLAMLNRVHGAGVNVDVGVKFLHGYFITAGL